MELLWVSGEHGDFVHVYKIEGRSAVRRTLTALGCSRMPFAQNTSTSKDRCEFLAFSCMQRLACRKLRNNSRINLLKTASSFQEHTLAILSVLLPANISIHRRLACHGTMQFPPHICTVIKVIFPHCVHMLVIASLQKL